MGAEEGNGDHDTLLEECRVKIEGRDEGMIAQIRPSKKWTR